MVLRGGRLPRSRRHQEPVPEPVGLAVVQRSWLAAPSPTVARALLGTLLVRDDATGRRVGRIVETEAYGGPDDRASHARFRSTSRNAVMFGPAGIAYVYLVYGMYDCVNVVAGLPGSAAAVLIRAVEPLEGLDLMRRDRARVGPGRRVAIGSGRPIADHALARGPGLVGACFGVDRSWTGTDLCDPASPLRLETDPAPPDAIGRIVAGPRVGVAYAGPDWAARPWRFRIDGHPSVSGPR